MPTIITEGDQTAVISTEHILDEDATNKTYVLLVDTNNMALGDVLELRVYTKVRSGGTYRVADKAVYSNVQAKPNKRSMPVPADIEAKFTLKQTAGTGRVFPWKVISL